MVDEFGDRGRRIPPQAVGDVPRAEKRSLLVVAKHERRLLRHERLDQHGRIVVGQRRARPQCLGISLVNPQNRLRLKVGHAHVFFLGPQRADFVEPATEPLPPHRLDRLCLTVVDGGHVGDRLRFVVGEAAGDHFRDAVVGVGRVGSHHGRCLLGKFLRRERRKLEPGPEHGRVGLEPGFSRADDVGVDAGGQSARGENFLLDAAVVLVYPLRLAVMDRQQVVAEPAALRNNASFRLEGHCPDVVLPRPPVLGRISFIFVARRLWLHHRIDGRFRAALEHPVEPVVVARGDRLELVVVAASTTHRQAEHAPCDHVDAVVDHVIVDPFVGPAADVDKSERCQIAIVVGRDTREVAGELRHDEPVERHVFVEGPHAPVAVGPGERIRLVLAAAAEAHAVGIPGHVKPVAGPPRAIPRAGEQAIHGRFKGCGRRVGGECIHLAHGRRHAGEIKAGPAHERAAVSPRRHRPAFGLEGCLDEGIDRRPHEVQRLDDRRLGIRDRLKRPVGAATLVEFFQRRKRATGRPRVGRTRLDPLHQIGDLLLRERIVGGHRLHPFFTTHGVDEPALVRLARHEGGPRGAAA